MSYMAFMERKHDTDGSYIDITIVQDETVEIIDGKVFLTAAPNECDAWITAPVPVDEHFFITADRELLENGWETVGPWAGQTDRWNAQVAQTDDMRFNYSDVYVAKFE